MNFVQVWQKAHVRGMKCKCSINQPLYNDLDGYSIVPKVKAAFLLEITKLRIYLRIWLRDSRQRTRVYAFWPFIISVLAISRKKTLPVDCTDIVSWIFLGASLRASSQTTSPRGFHSSSGVSCTSNGCDWVFSAMCRPADFIRTPLTRRGNAQRLKWCDFATPRATMRCHMCLAETGLLKIHGIACLLILYLGHSR